MTDPILQATDLVKSYHRGGGAARNVKRQPAALVRAALNGVSLALTRGEALGIVGESGSGKSTLVRCLTLLERPDTGSITLDGNDFTSMKGAELRHARRRIQIVFQDPYSSLNPRMTVGDALTEVLRVHRLVPRGSRPSRVRELLDMVGLPFSAETRYPSDFSGGQRQRICIARALAAEPEVLIADEAVSALDVSIQAQILNLFLTLREELKLTTIFVGHNLYVVRYVSQRVAVMFGGRVVEVLPPRSALDSARHPYTRALIDAIPDLSPSGGAELTERGVGESGALPANGCPYRDRCPRTFATCHVHDPSLVLHGPMHEVACHYADAVRLYRSQEGSN